MSESRSAIGMAAMLVMGLALTGCDDGGSSTRAVTPTTPSAVAVPTTTTTAPAPTAMPTDPLGPPKSIFVQAGDSWRYLDDGSEQGSAWRQPTFDDSAWATGAAEFGYGDNDEVTLVNFGPDQNDKFITTYFRKTFTVNDTSAHTLVTLDMIVDDGAIVYVNGVEAARANMPPGPATSATLANRDKQNSNVVVSRDIAPSMLVNGTNVIAVEVHQVAPDSPDISFNLALRDGEHSPQPRF